MLRHLAIGETHQCHSNAVSSEEALLFFHLTTEKRACQEHIEHAVGNQTGKLKIFGRLSCKNYFSFLGTPTPQSRISSFFTNRR